MDKLLLLKVAAVLYVLFGLTACPHYPHGYNIAAGSGTAQVVTGVHP